MFHLFLVLPALGFGAAMVALLLIPLWLGPLVQILLSALVKKRGILLIPALWGVAGMVSFVMMELLPLRVFLAYWLLYYALLLAAHAATRAIRAQVLRLLERRRGTDTSTNADATPDGGEKPE